MTNDLEMIAADDQVNVSVDDLMTSDQWLTPGPENTTNQEEREEIEEHFSNIEPCIGFELMELAGPIIDHRWKNKKRRASLIEELEAIKVDRARPEIELYIG
ncbi:hypothetical protein ACS0TY_007207 [Phlomoides rotata]